MALSVPAIDPGLAAKAQIVGVAASTKCAAGVLRLRMKRKDRHNRKTDAVAFAELNLDTDEADNHEAGIDEAGIDAFGLCICAAGLDGKLTYVSEQFQKVFGYLPEECIGRDCKFLQGTCTDMEAARRLGNGAREGYEVTESILNYTKDAVPVWNRVHLIPLRDPDQKLHGSIGIQLVAKTASGLETHRAHLEPLRQIQDIVAASSPSSRIVNTFAHQFPLLSRCDSVLPESNLTPVLGPTVVDDPPLCVLQETEAYFVTLALGSALRSQTLTSFEGLDRERADGLLSMLCRRWSTPDGLKVFPLNAFGTLLS